MHVTSMGTWSLEQSIASLRPWAVQAELRSSQQSLICTVCDPSTELPLRDTMRLFGWGLWGLCAATLIPGLGRASQGQRLQLNTMTCGYWGS
jgi:hypothetical protein